MNTKVIFVLITVICLSAKLKAQTNLVKNNFTENLKRFNLEFKMPDGFFEPDSINRAIYIAQRIFIINYQILSADSSSKICFITMKQSKEQEEKIRKFFPGHDITKEYLKFIEYLCKNDGEDQFDKKKINYYNDHKKNKLNADVALDYFIKLRAPFEGKYKYLRYRFIQNNYQAKIEIYQFYQNLDGKIERKLNNILKFKRT